MTVTARGLCLLLFFSGAAALIYEVVWTRLLSDMLGSTVLSMTCVFSVFLLSLALGAYLLGRLAVSGRAALKLYGALELAIAATGLMTGLPLLLFAPETVALLRGSSRWLPELAAQVGLTVAVIGVPTLLMGGTLPLIVNAARGWLQPRRVAVQLYAWNTLGAALGTLAAGFFLIWQLGFSGTLMAAASLNLLVGVSALVLAGRSREPSIPKEAEAADPESAVWGRRDLLWGALAFWSGFSVMAYEILWGRMAKFLLGDRILAVSSLLFIFILSLGLASLLAPWLARRTGVEDAPGALKLMARVMLAAALLHLLLIPVAAGMIGGSTLPFLTLFRSEFVRRVVGVWILMFPPVLAAGLVFPLLLWSSRRINRAPGRTIGRLYFVNTAGGTLGVAMATFALIRWMGTLMSFWFLTLAFFGVAVLLLVALPVRQWQKAAAVLAFGGLTLSGVLFPGSLVHLKADEQLILANEDEYGVQVLARTGDGMMRVRNNRLQLIYDLGHPQTSYAQQMAAHWPVLLAAGTHEVLNIGTGYGITAGAFTLYPEVGSIETVEILPFLVEHQDRFARYNFDYLKDSRVRLAQGDGRHFLLNSPKRYDIVSVNVLDPYLPGSSSLYTVDFWELVKERLTPGGVMTQLFWGEDLPLLVRGLKSVFPTVLYFPCYGDTSFNVVAFADGTTPPELRLERLSRPVLSEIAGMTVQDPLIHLQREMERAAAAGRRLEAEALSVPGPLHTDDLPLLEYRWAHGVSGISILDSPLVEQ